MSDTLDDGSLLLRNARVWRRPDESVSGPQDVLLRGGRIAGIGLSAKTDGGTPEVDLAGRVTTAGFWNCHVHLTEAVWSERSRAHAPGLQSAIDDMMLSRGFVTVVDLGSLPRTTNALIQRIETGQLRGPAIVTAGIGIRPWRGIPFYMRDLVPWFARWMLPMPLTRVGARWAVTSQLRTGAGVVKLFTGSYVTPERVKPMRAAVARAAVEQAHRQGVRVFAHPSNRSGTAVALDAAVDALAHVPDDTEGTAELLAEAARRGMRMIPTLHMFASTVRSDPEYLRPIHEALSDFIRHGGKVLFGTDVGYMPERETRPEFEAMADAGMSVQDMLRALTTEPASFFADEERGAVDVGHHADLTILDTTSENVRPADLAQIYATIRGAKRIWPASFL
ncbi:amidohydrolase family protein [Microbacterium sp. NPDC086615]|uniref:amidohydrolase family protein n=1 Tax=Microbacterium sp. NPDC086615 TaxID=3154865 RepID=UPI00341C37CC